MPEIDPDLYPEFGINTFLTFQELLPSFPNVNVYESRSVIEITDARVQVVMDAIANAPSSDLVGDESSRAEALERLANVRKRLAAWKGILDARVANLGAGETCDTLEEVGSGTFTVLYQPGPIDENGYIVNDYTEFGLTAAEGTTYFTPEYAAPDAYLSGYLQGDSYYAADDAASALITEQAVAYECAPGRKGFPWWLLVLGGAVALASRKR